METFPTVSPVDASDRGTERNTNQSAGIGVVQVVDGVTYRYQTGFGNELASEVLPGALPIGRNTPRHVPYHLYTEQLSGTAFTAPRAVNKRTWLYRIQPSVAQSRTFKEASTTQSDNAPVVPDVPRYLGHCRPSDCRPTMDPCRWFPSPPPPCPRSVEGIQDDTPTPRRRHWIDALQLVCHAGDASALHHGVAMYQYNHVTDSMKHDHFVNADGDFLIVPSTGTLHIWTELGRLSVSPAQVAVIPRGIVFSIHVSAPTQGTTVMGYVLEVYSLLGFQLPELGPIGSNGLANARDFLYPVAWCHATRDNSSNSTVTATLTTKMQSQLVTRPLDHSPYNVVAWHGTYAPYQYDLNRFCAVNSVTYDHLDPSLYTVLTVPSDTPGVALVDFVIFPPRVVATDAHTLRPPWFHKNCASEFMGLVYGAYDAKTTGFVPGGASLHNGMVHPHGPDAAAYDAAVHDPCDTPVRLDGGLAFMFETCLTVSVAPHALEDATWRDMDYATCWHGLSAQHFTGWDALDAVSSSNEPILPL